MQRIFSHQIPKQQKEIIILLTLPGLGLTFNLVGWAKILVQNINQASAY
jgi:hypothetical protein